MMKFNTILKALLASLSILLLASCGDSPEKLMQDKIDYIGDMAEVIDGLAEGKLSSSEATEKIKELASKEEEFVEREKKLFKDLSAEERTALEEKFTLKTEQKIGELLSASAKLVQSGRATKEFQDAMSNTRNH